MLLLKFAFIFILIVFGVSAFFGLVGFLIDIIKYPQKHKKIEVISSSSAAELQDTDADQTAEGLLLDENIEIDL